MTCSMNAYAYIDGENSCWNCSEHIPSAYSFLILGLDCDTKANAVGMRRGKRRCLPCTHLQVYCCSLRYVLGIGEEEDGKPRTSLTHTKPEAGAGPIHIRIAAGRQF